MKRIYAALCVVLVFAMLLVGAISLFDKNLSFSQVEERALEKFPKLTVSGILDGSFMAALTDYYTDNFPGREGLAQRFLEWDIVGITPAATEETAEK